MMRDNVMKKQMNDGIKLGLIKLLKEEDGEKESIIAIFTGKLRRQILAATACINKKIYIYVQESKDIVRKNNESVLSKGDDE